MSRNTSQEVLQAAREMRKNPTPAEKALWIVLRNRAVNGLRFRRQHALDGLVMDFYCAEVQLCVELDGGVHDTSEQRDRDAARTEHLSTRGIRVLRFRNEEVLTDIRSVLTRIAKSAAQPRSGTRLYTPPTLSGVRERTQARGADER